MFSLPFFKYELNLLFPSLKSIKNSDFSFFILFMSFKFALSILLIEPRKYMLFYIKAKLNEENLKIKFFMPPKCVFMNLMELKEEQ